MSSEAQSIAAIWRSRAAAEGSVHRYAQSIAADLALLDPVPAVRELSARMVADEARHVGICMEIAARFDGHHCEPSAPRAITDWVDDAPAELRPLLRLMGTCIGESIAVVWVDRSAAEVSDPWLRDLLRAHLADEVHHARIGWAHLASGKVMRAQREALATWLPELLAASLRAWRWFPEVWPAEGFPEAGLPSHAVTHACIDDALREVVLPGLARHDLGPLDPARVAR